MKEFTIELNPGERQVFTFAGWRRDRLAFYARDADGSPKLIELSPAYPWCNPDDGKPFEFASHDQPAEIFPICLVRPICVASKDEIPRSAKNVYLFPQPTHDPALCGALKSFLAKAAKDQAAEIDTLQKASSQDLFPLHGTFGEPKHPLSPEVVEAARQRKIKEVEDKYRPRLSLKIEGLKRGEDDFARELRDAVLIKSWAKEPGTDLNQLRQSAQEFESQWLRASGSEYPPRIEDMWGDRASVSLGIRFALGATYYLRRIDIRDVMSVDEAEDFQKLEGLQKLQKPSPGEGGKEGKTNFVRGQSVTADSARFDHSPNYRQLFWTENGAKQQANLTKTQASAISALHKAQGLILAREELQQEIYGDEPPGDFRPDKIFNHGDGRKVWDRFIRVDGERYRLVIERE